MNEVTRAVVTINLPNDREVNDVHYYFSSPNELFEMIEEDYPDVESVVVVVTFNP